MKVIKTLKSKIPERYKVAIKRISFSGNDPKWRDIALSEKRKAYVFLAGFYQNLGDMAITYAQIRFLKQYCGDAQIVAVPSNATYSAVKTIKNYIRPNDIVTIIGGGNMSDMYQSLEDARLHVVKNFKNNKIISFPQTILFSDGKELKRSRKIYSSHPNLVIFAREKASYDRAKNYFPTCKIELCPDIVLYLNESSCNNRDEKILCCMRNDIEKSVANEQQIAIKKKLNNSKYEIVYKDTVDVSIDECSEDKYEDTLNEYWNIVKSSKLVVTDRLHCMLFCTITGTPCIAFDNSNHKVQSVFDTWLKTTPYIHVLNGETDELTLADYLKEKNTENTVFDRAEEFATLRHAVM